MELVVLSFPTVAAFAASLRGRGPSSSQCLRSACSFLRRRQLLGRTRKCLSSECAPLTLNKMVGKGCRPGMGTSWLCDLGQGDLSHFISLRFLSGSGPFQIFNSLSIRRDGTGGSGAVFKLLCASQGNCSGFHFKTFHLSSGSECKNSTSYKEFIFCDLLGVLLRYQKRVVFLLNMFLKGLLHS